MRDKFDTVIELGMIAITVNALYWIGVYLAKGV